MNAGGGKNRNGTITVKIRGSAARSRRISFIPGMNFQRNDTPPSFRALGGDSVAGKESLDRSLVFKRVAAAETARICDSREQERAPTHACVRHARASPRSRDCTLRNATCRQRVIHGRAKAGCARADVRRRCEHAAYSPRRARRRSRSEIPSISKRRLRVIQP
jgi:hypothetical protein